MTPGHLQFFRLSHSMVCFACFVSEGDDSHLRNHARSLLLYDNHDFLEQLDAECRARVRAMSSILSVLRVTARESSTRPRKVAASIPQVTVSSALAAVLTSSLVWRESF